MRFGDLFSISTRIPWGGLSLGSTRSWKDGIIPEVLHIWPGALILRPTCQTLLSTAHDLLLGLSNSFLCVSSLFSAQTQSQKSSHSSISTRPSDLPSCANVLNVLVPDHLRETVPGPNLHRLHGPHNVRLASHRCQCDGHSDCKGKCHATNTLPGTNMEVEFTPLKQQSCFLVFRNRGQSVRVNHVTVEHHATPVSQESHGWVDRVDPTVVDAALGRLGGVRRLTCHSR